MGLGLDEAVALTRTGDLWLFRGRRSPDRAIQTLTNSPVNHVGMAVVIDDLTPRSLMPDKWAKADLVREYWLDGNRFIATELLTTPDTAAIVSVRR